VCFQAGVVEASAMRGVVNLGRLPFVLRVFLFLLLVGVWFVACWLDE